MRRLDDDQLSRRRAAMDAAMGGRPVAAVPRDQWPAPVAAVALLARPGDVGVGTTIERLAATAGIGAAYKAIWKTLGSSCGCDARRDALDAKYPYA